MTIGIIADLHDHGSNLDRFAAQARRLGLTELWCAGDIGSVDTYRALLQSVSTTIRAVAGNLETDLGLPAYAALAHDHSQFTWYPDEPSHFSCADSVIELRHHPDRTHPKVDSVAIVISGHTHAPTLAARGGTWFVNPGTLSGWPNPATYALLDFNDHKPVFHLRRLYESR